MIWQGSFHGGAAHRGKYPIYGAAADIAQGAVVMRGTSTGTDLGLAGVGASALADSYGVLCSLHDYSVVGDSATTGDTWVYGDVYDDPMAIFRAEVSLTDTATGFVMAAAASAGTQTNINAATFDSMWVYVVSDSVGSSEGQLHFIEATSATDVMTFRTVAATAIDTTNSNCIIIPEVGSLKVDLNSAATKVAYAMGTAGWANAWEMRVLGTHIVYDGIALERLDPTKHDAKTGLQNNNVHFFCDLIFGDHFANPA